ncbi:kinesin family member 15 [Angomonas deanei]|uniref:Microtubule binding/Kinesin motor domain containing protein, putative n=1 Tax=Angomonas deanei TaxID=59799 RepID=A0A7G2CPX4_9TRYP|nr:kinesin family member 15 [Angomonas deanei]CAD2221014.1 Microtubule binding/Kinesin motor domain containing protein, putative [Angomonas deanei]|eukprot:EPY32831.1 kinesin family member 15 [Angomonas deanei]
MTPPASVNPKKALKEAQRIVVSSIENIIIMHDPKAVDCAATVAKDASNVVQVLTTRAGKGSRTSSGTRKSGRKSSTYQRGLTSTATANYYECDECVVSMDEASRLKMPLVKSSDFLQPPPYGSQEDIFRSTARHAVEAAVEGINSCVFAYGQTGSGKTYTLFGDTANLRHDPGVVIRTVEDLFAQLEAVKATYQGNSETDYSYTVSLSFFEIYQNEVHCLLSRQGPLHVQYKRDAGGKKETMIIHDLQQQVVTSPEKAYPLIELGLRRRQTGETGMNARSSRSHALVQLRVTQWKANRETRETVELHSTINLVDLAGSERQKTANTDGKSREEGIQINQSLATLARVINDIARGAKFVNYRDSLLTMVLKDNLGGNSKTFMIANISPIAFSFQESCATLTYAKDVRKIRNRPTVNKSFQTRANLVEINMRQKTEIERLKEQLEEVTRRAQNGDFALSSMNENGLLVDGISPIRGCALSESPQQRGKGYDALLAGGLGYEAVLSANAKGLTAPLMVSSHRRYKNIAGIGSTCVEDGLVRVTSLVHHSTRFSVADMLRQKREEDKVEKELSTPNADSPVAHDPMEANAPQEEEEDMLSKSGAFGYVEVEKVSQRACDQRVWVKFIAPNSEEGNDRLVDVQLNGKSLGSAHRELYHGDVIAVYLDGERAGGQTYQVVEDAEEADKENRDSRRPSVKADSADHSLVAFHFVDLNCLSRASASMNTATLGQLAVSVDVEDDMEQLKRDNAKLLDMVRNQAQTIDYQCQRESMSRLSSISGRQSPNPNPVDRCLALTPSEARQATAEAFRRMSVSPSIRGHSTLPADISEEEMRHRAEQSVSQRLESAMRENESLVKKNVRHNAELDELARRLAELDAGDVVVRRTVSSSSSEESSEEGDNREKEVSVSVSPSCARNKSIGNVSLSPENVGFSVTRVSSSSDDDEADNHHATTRAPTTELRPQEPPLPVLQVIESHAPKASSYIFLETAEGTRERFHGAFRERQQMDRISELERLVEELRAQIALLESRLRVSQDDTLEQQLLKEAAEAERDAALEELQALRGENTQLLNDVETLEAMLKGNEEALAAAMDMNEEEIAKRLALVYQKLKATQELARLWKRRCMRYIAKGYGTMDEVNADPQEFKKLDDIPWAEMRAGATAQIAKYRLGGKDYAGQLDGEQQKAVDEFEEATAQEALVAYESVLHDLEGENQRLQDTVKRYQDRLRELQDLLDRLKAERDRLEVEAADGAVSEEEKKRLQKLLKENERQLNEARDNLHRTQGDLDNAVKESDNNKRKAVKNNKLLLAELRAQNEALEREKHQLQVNLTGKDDELRNLINYMEGNEMLDKDGTLQDYHLRNRIEDLITEAMGQCSAPSGYSAFPADFEFSEEMIALIRICLRIMMDRMKIELYVLNKQNVHRLSLLIPSIQIRPEVQFHTFMHDLRGVVIEVAGGRQQRIGGKWSIEEPDVLSDLVDHRRRRASNALSGLLVWYDHWDLSPKNEHICYMELIRNSDRIMQMARLVRQESLLNTNATSTLLIPIPGKNGASDTSMMEMTNTARRKDSSSVLESRKILNRLSANSKRGQLAQAVSPTKDESQLEAEFNNKNNDNPFKAVRHRPRALAADALLPYRPALSMCPAGRAVPSLNLCRALTP